MMTEVLLKFTFQEPTEGTFMEGITWNSRKCSHEDMEHTVALLQDIDHCGYISWLHIEVLRGVV
jgi:hypothetical protein